MLLQLAELRVGNGIGLGSGRQREIQRQAFLFAVERAVRVIPDDSELVFADAEILCAQQGVRLAIQAARGLAGQVADEPSKTEIDLALGPSPQRSTAPAPAPASAFAAW